MINVCAGIAQLLPIEEGLENEGFSIPKCMTIKCLSFWLWGFYHLLLMHLAALLQLAGVQTGDVVLKDLQLKAEALNALKLPITVKAGFLGSVTLKVQCVFVAQFKAETLCAGNCYILSLCDIFQP